MFSLLAMNLVLFITVKWHAIFHFIHDYCTHTKVLGNGSLICFQLDYIFTHTHTCTLYPNHVANIIDDQGTNNSLPLQNDYKFYVV